MSEEPRGGVPSTSALRCPVLKRLKASEDHDVGMKPPRGIPKTHEESRKSMGKP